MAAIHRLGNVPLVLIVVDVEEGQTVPALEQTIADHIRSGRLGRCIVGRLQTVVVFVYNVRWRHVVDGRQD